MGCEDEIQKFRAIIAQHWYAVDLLFDGKFTIYTVKALC
jgi:hypothetical protein